MKQITKETERGTDWLVNVNEVIDNPESLIYYLQKTGAIFKNEGKNIWATEEDCIKADEYAAKNG